MRNLVENFKHYLTEHKNVYNAEILIRAEPGSQLHDDIFEKIRAIEGITVIRASEAIKRDERNNKLMKLSVRFYIEAGSAIPYLEKVKNKIRTMRDEDGDRILSVTIRSLPKKSEDF